PEAFAYEDIGGLSIEVIERLKRTRPATLGQAMRVPGVTPAAGALLFVHLDKKGRSARPLGQEITV
ncbi:MAG: hypothetical protein EOP11_21195, partial [Proteobacteria bacterium]